MRKDAGCIGVVNDFSTNFLSSASDLVFRLFRNGHMLASTIVPISIKIHPTVFEDDDLGYICDKVMHEFFEGQDREFSCQCAEAYADQPR